MAEEVSLDEIKKIIEEGQKKKKSEEAPRVKVESVDEIVRRMREKYEQEGRYLVEEGKEEELEVVPTVLQAGGPENLPEHENPFVRAIGRIYLRIRGLVDAILGRIVPKGFVKRLDVDLYAANIPLTGKQYLAIVGTLALLLSVLIFLILLPLTVYAPLVAIAFFFLFLAFLLTYPRRRAYSRSIVAEKQLPYALRHLVVIIRSGMGLYQALRAVARGGYGVLSEEFSRTLEEIDSGLSTEAALSNLALRMRSKGMKRTVAQIVRALRIGGNITNVIMDIARDVAFEQRMRVAEFAERLNVFGIMYLFGAVVFPLMFAIIAAVGYSPVSMEMLRGFQIDPTVLAVLYLAAIPMFMILFLTLIRKWDPTG